MIPEAVKGPLADFVSMADRIPNLRVAVLFGSAVTGEFHKKSDIDILLLFDSKGNPEVGREAEVAHEIASESLSNHNVPHSFSFVMENLNDPKLDTQFLREVAERGIIVWARPELKLLTKRRADMEPVAIFTYSLSNLRPRDKMAVHRALYGYRVERYVRGKKYVNESAGIINEHGEKLADGVLMVPSRFAKEISTTFEKHGVIYRRIDLWT